MIQKLKNILFAASFLLVLVYPFTVNAASLVSCGGNEGQYAEGITDVKTEVDKKIRRQNYPSQQAYEQAYSQEYANQLKTKLNQFEANSCRLPDLFKQIAKITNILIGFIGLFVVFRFVDIGFGMVTSFGNPSKMKSLRESMEGAALGLILVLCSYALVNTIFYLFLVKVGGNSQAISFPYNPFAQ